MKRQVQAHRLLADTTVMRKVAMPPPIATSASHLPGKAKAYLSACRISLSKPEVSEFANQNRISMAAARKALLAVASKTGMSGTI